MGKQQEEVVAFWLFRSSLQGEWVCMTALCVDTYSQEIHLVGWIRQEMQDSAGGFSSAAVWMSEDVENPGKLEVLEQMVLNSMIKYRSFQTITQSKNASCYLYTEDKSIAHHLNSVRDAFWVLWPFKTLENILEVPHEDSPASLISPSFCNIL